VIVAANTGSGLHIPLSKPELQLKSAHLTLVCIDSPFSPSQFRSTPGEARNLKYRPRSPRTGKSDGVLENSFLR
jgi:hypothetical protein